MNYSEAKERERLLKKLEPRYQNAKLVFLGVSLEINNWRFAPDYYLLVSEPFRGLLGRKIVTIIDLEKTMKGHNFDISGKTHEKGFSCWRINLDYFEDIKEFKPLIASSNFLWKGEDNDN